MNQLPITVHSGFNMKTRNVQNGYGLLDNFFSQKFGTSLVIKGKPGAGKTTFALGYLEGILGNTPVCYLSSRFSDDSLFESFPWLKGVSIKNREGGTQSDLTSVSTDSLQKLERMHHLSSSFIFLGLHS